MASLFGIEFPYQQSATAYPAPAYDADVIEASVIQILITPRGSRVMRGNFGTILERYIFESNTTVTVDGIESEVRRALSKYEPRVRVTLVSVNAGDVTEPGAILVSVDYVIISSNTANTVTVSM